MSLKTQISILWPVCLRNLFHLYFAVCPSFSSRASARFLPAPPFQQQRTTKSSVDRAKKECGSDNKWMKTSFFPIDNMLQQNIQTSPIADYFLKGNIRVITTMPCKLVLERGFVTPCRRLFIYCSFYSGSLCSFCIFQPFHAGPSSPK